jgi:hypothetical protein
MLAYVFWHRPAAGVETDAYEQALRSFHRSLAHSPPSGFRGSATLRAAALPWLADQAGWSAGGYEDWYLVDGWESLGVLEGAAVGRGHETSHHEAARRYGRGTASIYRHVEGAAMPAQAKLAVWITRPPGKPEPAMEDLLQDGIEAKDGALWRRCLVLGPAPEICLLSVANELPADGGVAPGRLPEGWTAAAAGREALADD